MKRLHIYTILILLVGALFAQSCKDVAEPGVKTDGEGSLLNMTVSFASMAQTRLAELGSVNNMNEAVVNGKNYGLSHIGLYIYYASDYRANDLSQPYIRNMKCEVKNGKLVPVLENGQTQADLDIYIYDQMTLVAFYPYNEEMSLEENYFQVQTDEDNYYITRNDYVEQYYIPYRAATTTNPTISYYTELYFVPKHTYKVEVVVVSDDESDFVPADEVIILPNIDPITTEDTDLDGRRAKWYDQANVRTNRTGGSNVRQYVTYIWTKELGDNDIPRGEILLQAGKLTLIASQDVPVQQQHVYRYGYNMSTGEIFIPTSSNLIWDAESLAAYKGGDTNGYQVCDIDLAGVDWKPSAISKGRFDGGGHKISNLTINSGGDNVGLFSEMSNNAVVCNVNLIDPVITVNSTNPSDTTAVGAICGKVSNVLSQEAIDEILANLPPNLSEVVKQAIIKDLLADALNSTCKIASCRVDNPTIVVNATYPMVGTICGTAGETGEDGDFKAVIWSSYNLAGSIAVNVGNEADNAGGYVGGFCGLNNGRIFGSYTTIEDITFDQKDADGVLTEDYTGFTTMGDLFSSPADAGLTDDYSVLPDPNGGVSQMPGSWPSWSSQTPYWPVHTTSWLGAETSYWYDYGAAPDNYPILQWERR